MYIPTILENISDALEKKNAKAIIVGGSVRDHFLKLPIKDYDIEVYGLESLEVLEKVLAAFGSVNLVGKSFGVLKFTYDGEEYDFSFPRLESKVSEGHRGFDVMVDGMLDFKTAAKRRDFTVNAMGYDVVEKVFIDPFKGLDDIKLKRLKHIDDDTFIEDPLRVYRAVQFSARFGFRLADETLVLCKNMVFKNMLEELPKERIYLEWKKLLLKAAKPSLGFVLMRELGIIQKYLPELDALIGIPQSPKWHPEGDVWIHTLMTLDVMARELKTISQTFNDKKKLMFMFAMLCHDLGKVSTTSVDEDGKIRAIGHEGAGVEPTKRFLYRLMDEDDFIKSVLPFVEHHLKPSQFYTANSKAGAIRRLATKVNIEDLVLVSKADFLGRTTKEALVGEYKAGEWLLQKASELNVINKPLEALIQGRDLIALGFTPSPQFKTILEQVYTLQLEGTLTNRTDALEYLKNSDLI